jgi:hypothetical protein
VDEGTREQCRGKAPDEHSRTVPRRRRTLRRLDAVRAYRSPADTDDIADPIGQRPAVHEEVAGTIAASLRPLAEVLFTSVRDQPVLRVPA